MSVVDAPERFVAEPTDETLAESAVEDVFVVRTRVARAPTWPGFLPRPHRQARARNVYALVALTGQQLHDNAYPVFPQQRSIVRTIPNCPPISMRSPTDDAARLRDDHGARAWQGRPAAGVFYSWFSPACGDCVDTGSMPGVLVTAGSSVGSAYMGGQPWSLASERSSWWQGSGCSWWWQGSL